MTGLATSGTGVELLDDPNAEPEIVRSSLGHIARANRWLGGTAAVRFGLANALGQMRPGATLSLLDVGTGAGDLPNAARDWGARRGFCIVPMGVDRSIPAAQLASRNGVAVVVACGGTLPVRDRSVDVVLVSQVIHHLRRDAAVHLLLECDRIARRAVIVADLEHARLALAGFWLTSRLLRFDAATRADGLTSVRRGYRPAEFRSLFEEAGLPVKTWRRPAYRLVAVWHPA